MIQNSRLTKYCYVPKFILENFVTSKDLFKTGIYQFDKRDKTEDFASIDSIQYGDYSFMFQASNIISEKERTLIDCCFKRNEKRWNEIIKSLIKNKQISEEEKNFLYMLFVIEFMRTPEFEKMNWKDLKKKKVRLSQEYYDRYSSISKKISGKSKLDSDLLLNSLLANIAKYNLYIYKAENDFMINSQRPIIYDQAFYFPVSKNLCLALTKENVKDFYRKEDISVFVDSKVTEAEGLFIYGGKSLGLEKGVKK